MRSSGGDKLKAPTPWKTKLFVRLRTTKELYTRAHDRCRAMKIEIAPDGSNLAHAQRLLADDEKTTAGDLVLRKGAPSSPTSNERPISLMLLADLLAATEAIIIVAAAVGAKLLYLNTYLRSGESIWPYMGLGLLMAMVLR